MSNKTQLQTNNNALEALITRVNAAKDTAASLPEAGGAVASSPYKVTIINEGDVPDVSEQEVFYGDGKAFLFTCQPVSAAYAQDLSITPSSVLANEIIVRINGIEKDGVYQLSNITSDVEVHIQWTLNIGDFI